MTSPIGQTFYDNGHDTRFGIRKSLNESPFGSLFFKLLLLFFI